MEDANNAIGKNREAIFNAKLIFMAVRALEHIQTRTNAPPAKINGEELDSMIDRTGYELRQDPSCEFKIIGRYEDNSVIYLFKNSENIYAIRHYTNGSSKYRML